MEIKTFILKYTDNLDKISCHSYDPEYLELENKIKSSKFKVELKKLLSEKVISGPMGFQLHTYDYVPDNYPDAIKLLQISNIDKFGKIINTNRDKYISKEKDKELKNSHVKKNDLIIAKTGTLGRLALFDEDYEANLNQALGIIRLKEEYDGRKVVPEFIHFYLNSFFAFEQFMALGGYRSGQSGLSLDEIGTIQIILPEEKEQREILNKIDEIKNKISSEQNKYYSYLDKISNLLDDYAGLDLSNISQTWVAQPEKIFDRIDCYFNSQQLDKIFGIINSLDEDKFEIVKSKDLNLIKAMDKNEREENKSHVFKYVDIGNTEKDLGEIKGHEEDILFNLPSRAKMKARENDILIPRPIGSTQGIVKVNKEFDNQLFTTGNIQIRPDGEDDAFLLWTMLKSNIMQKQFFYLQSGCSQPEISPNNFKKYVLFPFPKGEIKKEIITKSKEYYKEALKHQGEISNLQKTMINVFNKEIKKYI